MRKPRGIAPKTNPAFAVVVDGETEVWYLEMLKRNERGIRVNIEPKIPNKKSIEAQYNQVRALSNEEYTRVFWIVDFDTIAKEAREAVKGKKSPVETFKVCRAKLAKYKNVVVVVNNPCLEFWFLLHFEKTQKCFGSCTGAETQLKTHLNDYEKTQKYFKKQDDDIYLKLKPDLKTAVENSLALGRFDAENPTKAMCEMALLFETPELKALLGNDTEQRANSLLK